MTGSGLDAVLRKAYLGGDSSTSGPSGPSEPKYSLFFTIEDRPGGLSEVLAKLKGVNVSLTRIESRPSRAPGGHYDFFVDFAMGATAGPADAAVARVLSELEPLVKEVKLLTSGNADSLPNAAHAVPWFPRKRTDLDSFAEKVLSFGAELDADHPGFRDAEYRQRRDEITQRAREYRTGMPLPRVEYTATEIETWGIVFRKLTELYPKYACREHRYIFPLLIENCGYRADQIPQIEDVSRFLKDCTGFTLRPVMGLLSSRDFLNGLAFRVFHSTQYIRHHSSPLYTPEPDVCHELLGHCPLFADPDFADFSQEIGLASLGASDADIERLSTIYWFTVEFGVCREDGAIKAYGAGLLSSFGELEYCVSSKPTVLPFEPAVTALQKYPITEYQPVYFVASSFKEAKEKVREFARGFNRPFEVRYNALTETIEVLDNKEKLLRYATNIRGDLSRLISALEHL